MIAILENVLFHTHIYKYNTVYAYTCSCVEYIFKGYGFNIVHLVILI